MEMRLVDYFADEFRNQTGIDIRNNPKAMAKLKKQVKRTKQILSANTEAPLSVEALHEDVDFRCSLTYCLFVTLEFPFSSLLICSMNVRGNVEDWTFLPAKELRGSFDAECGSSGLLRVLVVEVLKVLNHSRADKPPPLLSQSFDFSTLYTKINSSDLEARMKVLVNKVFDKMC
jgi:hypothetical protein